MLRDPTELNPENLSYLGLGWQPNAHGSHVIFIYAPTEGGACRVSHLEWHNKFSDDLWNGGYYWTTIAGIQSYERKMLCARLESFATSSPAIAYGLSSVGCEIVEDGTGGIRYSPGESGKGLTCASYVLLILETYGYYLLCKEDWPSRPEDIIWQQKIVQLLKKHSSMTNDEIAAVEKDIGSVRFRPAEVVGAASQEAIPVTFETACNLAAEIQSQIRGLC